MNKESLKLFEKKKGIFLMFEQKTAIFLTIGLFLLIIIEKQFEKDYHDLVTPFIVIWGFSCLALAISVTTREQLVKGKFIGEIVFEKDKIILGEINYNLNEISKISFEKSYDIKGIATNHMIDFAPKKSNGLDNVVKIFLSNGEKLEFNFLQTKNRRLKNYKDTLIDYYKLGLIEWLQLLNILGINNYKKIQDFKKEIINYGQQSI